MNPNKQGHTFISYSRVNKEFALKLAKELKAAGFLVWLDVLDIPAGARWDDEIEKALRECGIFLTILTPASIASENAKDEMGYAIDHGKRILPVLLQECDIPLRLRRFQYVDFTSMNYDQGVRTAKDLLGKLIKEQSVPIPKKPSPSKERPTQPVIAKASQLTSELRQPEPAETARSPKRESSVRPIVIYASIAVLILLALIGGAGALGGLFLSQKLSPTSVPTGEILPTSIPSPTIIPETPTPAPQGFYTEEFEGNLDAWRFATRSGKDNQFNQQVADGKLVVRIDPREDKPWAHLINNTFKYADVQLEAVVTNNGNNANGVSLICRYSDSGWIEFTVSNNQTYSISVFDPSGETLQGGGVFGSKKILSGMEKNTYTATCKGNELSLSVNGAFLKTIKINHDFPEGNIGIGFSAPGNVPVDVAFESLKVSQP